MDLPLSDLPDDVDALKAMVLALAREQAAKEVRLKVAEAEIARLEAVEKSANERIANLTLIMKVLQRTQNGKRSERLRLGVNDEQVSFAFEEVETGLSAIRSELDRAAKDKPKRAPRPRKGFAAHLERIEEVIEPYDRHQQGEGENRNGQYRLQHAPLRFPRRTPCRRMTLAAPKGAVTPRNPARNRRQMPPTAIRPRRRSPIQR